MTSYRTALLLAAATFAALALPSESLAQSKFTGTFAPIRAWGQPGTVINRELSLKLTESVDGKPLRFRAYAQDFWQSEDGLSVFYGDPGKVARSCASWISVDPANQVVAPGGNLEVRVSVAVPKDVTPGGYWCAVSVDEQMDPRRRSMLKGSGMVLFASFSNAIYVFVKPLDIKARLTAVDMRQDEVAIGIANEGDTPVLVQGRVEFLREGQEEPVATADIERKISLTQPSPQVQVYAPLPSADELPDGAYILKVVVDIGLEHLIGAQARRVVSRAKAD